MLGYDTRMVWGKAKLVERTFTYIYYYGLFFTSYFHLLRQAFMEGGLEMESMREILILRG